MKKGGRQSSNVEDRTDVIPSMGGPRVRSVKNITNRAGKAHLQNYKAVRDMDPETSRKMENTLIEIRASRKTSRVRFE